MTLAATGDTDRDAGYRAEWGLRRYVQHIALGLGIGLESACCEAASPATAYLALTQRLGQWPGRDIALFWGAPHGWALGVETGSGEDLIVVAYLGGEALLAEPETVVSFAKTLLAGQEAGQPDPPALRGGDLRAALAAYVDSALAT